MNLTLQCLSQTKELTNYFLNEKNKDRIINNNIALKNKNDLQLSPVYLELIQKLWDKNGPKSFSPNTFKNTVEKMNPLFEGVQVGDSKDFIIFIIEQLHKELKNPIKIKADNILPLNQYDKNNALLISLMNLKRNVQLYQIYFMELLKQQINVLIVKIFLIQKDKIIQYVIIM